VRIGSVYAAHKRSLEVFFSQSLPPPFEDVLGGGLGAAVDSRWHGGAMMPTRKSTRAADRTARINAERAQSNSDSPTPAVRRRSA
jgi:hypothetical protein